MTRAAYLLLAMALAGCTTIDDFRRMSPQERAIRVCDRDAQVKQLRQGRQFYIDAIAGARDALARGYRVHRECQTVHVPAGRRTTCEKTGDRASCRESEITREETRCKETLITLQPDHERQNLVEWGAAASNIEAQLETIYGQCQARVLRMTPEEAFGLY